VINLKQELGARQMRAIAEEAFAMVREYKGSHSGEHGDGLVRSEHHEAMFGARIVRAPRRYFSQRSGSSGLPPLRTSKWRIGPFNEPESPERAIVRPDSTSWPTVTSISDRWP